MNRSLKWLLTTAGVVLWSLSAPTGPAWAQDYPIGDWQHRGQVSVSSGYLQFQPIAPNDATWKGVDVGGSLTYSLHPLMSVYGFYGHGFALESENGGDNQARLSANLLVYPAPDAPKGPWRAYLGAGGLWRGTDTVKDWTGIETHLALAAALNQSLGVYAAYFHGFAGKAGQSDMDWLRVGLNARLWP